MYIYIYTYTYTYIYNTHTHTHITLYEYVYLCVYICIYTYSCAGEEGAARTEALKHAISRVVSKAEQMPKLRLTGCAPKFEEQ